MPASIGHEIESRMSAPAFPNQENSLKINCVAISLHSFTYRMRPLFFIEFVEVDDFLVDLPVLIQVGLHAVCD